MEGARLVFLNFYFIFVIFSQVVSLFCASFIYYYLKIFFGDLFQDISVSISYNIILMQRKTVAFNL